MSTLTEILASFNSVSLDEMDDVKLLDRLDTKFLFPIDQLPQILNNLQPFYRILEVEGNRSSQYETIYYDTNDFLMYRQHLNGKSNRFKIRFRHYMDSGIAFFEIKFRNNKGHTIKERLKKQESLDIYAEGPRKLIAGRTGLNPDQLSLVLNVYYSRITLVDIRFSERVTIDTGLYYKNEKGEKSFSSLVIAEVKQERNSRSEMISILRKHHVRQVRISKYCLGIIQLYENVKKNNFKPKLIELNKICHAIY